MTRAHKHLIAALSLAALAISAWAQTETARNDAPPSPATVTTTTAPTPQPPVTAADIQALKDALAAQQQQIQALKEQLEQRNQAPQVQPSAEPQPQPMQQLASTSPISVVAPVAVSAPPPASQPASGGGQTGTPPQTVQSGSSDERIRNLERQIKGIGPISFSGDVRLRGEPFFGGPSNESMDRMRARVRVRFNALADLGSQFRAGITLASGDVNDPTTTNQTLTGFYTRKPVALDQAFVEFRPSGFKPLSLIGGKFRYPWFNTELTWDKDLNPEGVAETLAFKIDTKVLKRLAFIGFQLPFAEVANTSPTNQHIAQQITYGGQIQAAFQIVPRLTFSAFSAIYDFRGADSVAFALAKASPKNPQTPLTGLLPLGTGNTVQDSTYTTTATTIITVGGTAYPTGVSSVSNAQFASKFSLFDNIARFDIDTGHAKFPISFIGDYVQNMEACSNLPNILPAPTNTASTTYKQTLNAPCKSNQRRGYWAEGRVGRLQEKGDFQLGYTRIYIEREAVLGNFNYSDIRQGTNVTQHRFDSFYQFDRNVQLGFTALIGRPLGSTEPWLERLQFDTIFIF